jgi:glucan phosphoethanolaminetransferase (alkaline phosphatase superfamily)
MNEDAKLTIGIAGVVLLFAAVLLLAQVHPFFAKTRQIYEQYFDLTIVLLLALTATFLAVLAVRAYRNTEIPRLIYVAGAFSLYALRMFLTFLNMLSAPHSWLADSAVHVMDLGILLLFFIGVLVK